MEPRFVDVAIIGGGMGGLAVAAGLTRFGFDAHIFEAAPELRTDTGTIMCLKANAFAAFESLHPSLPDVVKTAACLKMKVTNIQASSDGKDVTSKSNAREPWYTMQWGEMQAILADLVDETKVHCSHKFKSQRVSSENSDETVVEFESAPSIHARLVIGADGAWSAVRQSLFGEDSRPRYLGQLNWNALLDNDNYELSVEGDDGVATQIHTGGDAIFGAWSEGEEKDQMTTMVNDCTNHGKGKIFWQIRMVDEEGVCPHGNGRGGSGAAFPHMKRHVLDLVQKLPPSFESLRVAIRNTPPGNIYERRIQTGPALERWSDDRNLVVLLGDAAHAMHPCLGRGAQTAFEDAGTLVRCLVHTFADGALNPSDKTMPIAVTSDGLREAVARYQRLRIGRCRIIQKIAELFGSRTAEMRAKRAAEINTATFPPRFMEWADAYPKLCNGDPESESELLRPDPSFPLLDGDDEVYRPYCRD